MQLPNGKFRGLFVKADDPAFLEKQIEPSAELLDLNRIDVADIRTKYLERQKNYDTTPFDPEGRVLRLFPGGYTIWSGYPGAGKTTLLRQLACHLLHRGRGVFVASLEEYPMDVFYRHAAVAIGSDDPSQSALEYAVFHWADKFRLWTSEELPANSQKLLAAIRVMAKPGVRHAVIDSLMCLDVGSTDWEGQRMFANSLMQTVRSSGIHVHLVAHPRKIVSSDQEPDINDVAGSADIGRLADNVVFVRRSKSESLSHDMQVTPMRIAVLKQRHGTGSIGEMAGWFHRGHKQFKADQFDTSRTEYLLRAAYDAEYSGVTL